jgi:PAS domain S-box-containing protein
LEKLFAFDGVDARLRVLAASQGLVIYRASPCGQVLSAPGWEEITGQSRDEALGEGFVEAIQPDDRGPFLERRRVGMTFGQAWDVEVRVRTRSGEWRWMRGQCSPVRSPAGSITEWIGSVADIHELKLRADATPQPAARRRPLLAA